MKSFKINFMVLTLSSLSLIMADVPVFGDNVAPLFHWNEERAKSITLNLLKNYGGLRKFDLECPSLGNNCAVTHQIAGIFYFKYINRTAAVVVAHTNTDPVRVVHSKGPPFSFFEFVENNNGWVLTNSHINAVRLGSWMKPPDNIKVLPIGYNKFGVVITDQYTSNWQGAQLDLLSIYSPIAGKFTEVFHAITGYARFGRDDQPDERVVGNISFVKEGTSFYDIVLEKNRIEPKFNNFKRITFTFDGRKYTSPDYKD